MWKTQDGELIANGQSFKANGVNYPSNFLRNASVEELQKLGIVVYEPEEFVPTLDLVKSQALTNLRRQTIIDLDDLRYEVEVAQILEHSLSDEVRNLRIDIVKAAEARKAAIEACKTKEELEAL